MINPNPPGGSGSKLSVEQFSKEVEKRLGKELREDQLGTVTYCYKRNLTPEDAVDGIRLTTPGQFGMPKALTSTPLSKMRSLEIETEEAAKARDKMVKSARPNSTLAKVGSYALKGLGMLCAGICLLGSAATRILKIAAPVVALGVGLAGAVGGLFVGAYREMRSNQETGPSKMDQTIGDGLMRGFQVGAALTLGPTTLLSEGFHRLAKGLSDASNQLLERAGLEPETNSILLRMTRFSPLIDKSPLEDTKKTING